MAVKCNLSGILGTKRISQREIARRTGLNSVTVNSIYNDRWKQISREAIDKLCKELDCKVSDLLEYVPEESKEGK
jgi:putative transcriptional regulator